MNLQNKLTLSRVLLVPVVLVFVLYPIGGELCARIVAAALFLIAALTDLFDGK
ncbi:MAG: CDP-alcohol phosphatidyltransferase family protein, partial [Candidatus Methanomethylophilaceae archaeon]|nr:CDP-alcohol phosphatidyltransferase family protein [Candidatus Methanomethylophilaceae archaeon]